MDRNRLGACALALLASLLVSCGGGGGGGGGSSSGGSSSGGGGGGVQFTPDRTSISFEFMEGDSGGAQQVVVTATGNLPETLYIGAVAEGSGINPAINIIISGTQATFQITPAEGLAEGTYNGRIQLMGCSDSACNRQVGNSPVIITYTTRVQPRLRVTPTSVNLNAVSGNTAATEVTVGIPWQQTTQDASVVSGTEWLSLIALSPNSWRIAARSMPSGTHEGSVQISSGPYSLMVPVTYVVAPPAGGEFDLRSNPTSLTFSATENTVATPATVTVLGPTWAANVGVQYFIGYNNQPYGDPWLTVTPINGGYRVTADARNLRAETYTANLVFEDTDPLTISTPVTVPVAFTVGAGIVRPADIDVVIDSNTTPNSPQLHGSVPINVADGPQIQWTASSDRSWVTLTRAAGDTGTSLEYSVDLASLTLQYNYAGDDTVNVTVTPSIPVMMPITFHVNLHRRLAHVDHVTPELRVLGRATRHVIRGGGFIAGRDWSQHLLFGDQPAAARVTRVSDTELLVDLAASQGSASISARNALDVYTGSAVITQLPVYNLGYEAVPTGFAVRKLLFDPQRLYVHLLDENNGLGLLHICAPTTVTGGWGCGVQTTVPGLKDAVRGIENRYLYVLSTEGLYTWDKQSSGNLGFPQLFPEPLHFPAFGDAMSMTNDGKLWFAVGDASNRGLAYVALPYGQMTRVVSPLLAPVDGPSFAVSRNRERLYVSQSSGAAPAPPLLALNAVDGALFTVQNQGSLTYLADASMSDDASRLIGQDFQVRDAQFNVIGNVVVTQNNYMSVAANVSAEGTRAYVLAYERNELTAPAPLFTPRVYVFNLSNPMGASQQMPLLGYFSLAHYPTCLRAANCSLRPQSALSEAGNTLFYAGDQNLIVTPIPAEGALLSRAPPNGVQKQRLVTKRMR